MTLAQAHGALIASGFRTLSTNDAAAILEVSPNHAAQILSRLSKTGQLVRLQRGRWVMSGRVHRLGLAEALTAPAPSYVSLHSALHHHGMIAQIPVVLYAVTLAPTKRLDTPLGTVSLHHVAPGFFFGFEEVDAVGAKVAVAEKALVDFLYLTPARSRLFCAVPELELPRAFSARRAREMIKRIASASRRTMIARALEDLLP